MIIVSIESLVDQPSQLAHTIIRFDDYEIKTFHDMLLRRSKSKDFENNTWKMYSCFLCRFLRWVNKSLDEINVNDFLILMK